VAKKQGLRFVFSDGSRIIVRWVARCCVRYVTCQNNKPYISVRVYVTYML
jgi:hypothetical protein